MSIYKNGKLIAGGRQCMPLLSFMWADHILNDVSWLRGDTFSWQDGGVYQAVYNHLVDDIPQGPLAITTSDNTVYVRNSDDDVAGAAHPYCWAYNSTNYYTVSETPSANDSIFLAPTGKSKDSVLVSSVGHISATPITETIAGITVQFYLAGDGHKICPASEESNVASIYAATGVAWYYILDTTNQRFKLPRVSPDKANVLDTAPVSVGVYGDGNALMTRRTSDGATGALTCYAPGNPNNSFYSQGFSAYNGSVGISTDPTNSGLVGSGTMTTNGATTHYSGKKYLYFYVGNFTQTALENTAGVTTEVLNDKVDKGHQVIELQEPTAANGYTWYRKYADGWVEQGGRKAHTSSDTTQTVNLPVEMADTNYFITRTTIFNSDNDSWPCYVSGTKNLTTTSFSIATEGRSGWIAVWEVKGMATQS